MYEAQYFDIHVQKVKPMVAETPLLCCIFYSGVTESTLLRENVPYFTRKPSFDLSAQLMWAVAKMTYANKANEKTEVTTDSFQLE
jgi:hypothetical protein